MSVAWRQFFAIEIGSHVAATSFPGPFPYLECKIGKRPWERGWRCRNRYIRIYIKALVNEDTLLRTHCCPWCFLGCANWETFVADTKCFWTKSETFLCAGHKISSATNVAHLLLSQANRETFVSATMCPQQCVLVCRDLYYTHWYRTIDEQ